MNPIARDLADPARNGIASIAAIEIDALNVAANAASLQVLPVDLRACQSKTGLLKRLARALRTPAEQSRNWDALADQLRDLGWLHEAGGYVLMFTHASALRARDPSSLTILLEILEDASRFWKARGIPFRAVFTLPDSALRVPGNSSDPR